MSSTPCTLPVTESIPSCARTHTLVCLIQIQQYNIIQANMGNASSIKRNKSFVSNAGSKKILVNAYPKVKHLPSLNFNVKSRVVSSTSGDDEDYTLLSEGFTYVSPGEIYPLTGKNLYVTIVTGEMELLCLHQQLEEGRGLIVTEEGIKMAEKGKLWKDDSGRYHAGHICLKCKKIVCLEH